MPSEAELQRLRGEAVKAIEAVDEEDYRTVVIDSWLCCRGTVFVEPGWRCMTFVLFLALDSRENAMRIFAKTFTVFFGPELRERRKILGLVWPHREHSLGFQQARDLVTELMVEYGMFKKSGLQLPLVGYAEELIGLGLLAERDGTLAFDGPLVTKVNSLYLKMAGPRIGCRLTVEVFLLITFNVTIGTPSIYHTVPRGIWSSCFWGSDSQSKAPLLKLLFGSYANQTYEDRRASALARRAFADLEEVPAEVVSGLDAIVASAAFKAALDVGYPDAAIKSSSEKNHETLKTFSADLDRVWEFMGWA